MENTCTLTSKIIGVNEISKERMSENIMKYDINKLGLKKIKKITKCIKCCERVYKVRQLGFFSLCFEY